RAGRLLPEHCGVDAGGQPTRDARAVLDRWDIAAPPAVSRVLSRPTGVIPPGDPRLARVQNVIVAAPARSLAAAATLAESAGCEVMILGDDLAGEARKVAADHAALARRLAAGRPTGAPPLAVLSGGELTVTRRGQGVGGRNAEYALALAIALDGQAGIHAIACDTDGIDGAAEVAG
ncbi:MAG TPA: MOFRL family protein, partial [Paracoccus sp. (in: a-proteobacteria)]|nr:MOFRL family protein [Paracoccus sp. (in: a-proteobacteria)]